MFIGLAKMVSEPFVVVSFVVRGEFSAHGEKFTIGARKFILYSHDSSSTLTPTQLKHHPTTYCFNLINYFIPNINSFSLSLMVHYKSVCCHIFMYTHRKISDNVLIATLNIHDAINLILIRGM